MRLRLEKIKHQKGYLLLYKPEHPTANWLGRVPEQRVIVEGIIGRYINPRIEEVHHKDGNVQNNNPDNLILLTKSEHRRFHNGWFRIDNEWWKTCQCCKRLLRVEGNFYKRTKCNEYVSECKECIKEKARNFLRVR